MVPRDKKKRHQTTSFPSANLKKKTIKWCSDVASFPSQAKEKHRVRYKTFAPPKKRKIDSREKEREKLETQKRRSNSLLQLKHYPYYKLLYLIFVR